MKQRVKTRNYPFYICLLALLVVSALFVNEKMNASKLAKRLAALDTVVAPYYDKEVFNPPAFLRNKTDAAKRIKIPIIMYHYVEYVKDAKDIIRKKLSISPFLFEQHLQALKDARYETYFVKDVPRILDGSIQYSTQSAILSFDDGYEDFYTEVFPLLKKYNMRATLYIITNYIGKKGFLNEAQIRELIESDLVEIGSHTQDHVYLKVSPKDYADTQIRESKAMLEDTFNIRVKTFAYPYGAFNEYALHAVEQAGYTAAVSVIPGQMQSRDNLFFLSRIRPELFTPQSMIRVMEEMNK